MSLFPAWCDKYLSINVSLKVAVLARYLLFNRSENHSIKYVIAEDYVNWYRISTGSLLECDRRPTVIMLDNFSLDLPTFKNVQPYYEREKSLQL